MTFNVNNLTSSINKSGVAKTSHFEVQITGPGSVDEERDIMTRADSCELPGRSLMTAEHKFDNYGPMNKVPYGGQVYTDSNITFILSEDMREKEYFEFWQDKMVGTGAFNTGVGTGKSDFNTQYFENYVSTINIRQYGSAGQLRSIHTLNEAYPISIAPVAMSWSEDDVARLSVSFAYRNYRVAYFKQDQPSLGRRGSFSIGPDGVSGSISLPGIGDFAATTAGIKTVQAKVGSINSKVARIRKFF